jgi:hypothetical protein
VRPNVWSAKERSRLRGSFFLHDLLDLPQTGEWRTLYDAMDNTARNRGKREVAAALVARGCAGGPLLIIVEDLHWADPLVLAYLAAFATAVANGPGLLVMLIRSLRRSRP